MSETIEKDPRYSESNLIWLDMEMTGLQPEVNRIIEIASVITDAQLNVLSEGPVIAIHQSEAVMKSMDSWNTATHGRSGLTKRVLESTISEEEATDICRVSYPPASLRCAATRSVRIDASWHAGCRVWKISFTTAALT